MLDVRTISKGTCLHELGHILGLFHEMQRADKDKYVTINWENIKPGAKTNFNKISLLGDCYGDFDFASIMMYQSHTGFSVKGPTHTQKMDNYALKEI